MSQAPQEWEENVRKSLQRRSNSNLVDYLILLRENTKRFVITEIGLACIELQRRETGGKLILSNDLRLRQDEYDYLAKEDPSKITLILRRPECITDLSDIFLIEWLTSLQEERNALSYPTLPKKGTRRYRELEQARSLTQRIQQELTKRRERNPIASNTPDDLNLEVDLTSKRTEAKTNDLKGVALSTLMYMKARVLEQLEEIVETKKPDNGEYNKLMDRLLAIDWEEQRRIDEVSKPVASRPYNTNTVVLQSIDKAKEGLDKVDQTTIKEGTIEDPSTEITKDQHRYNLNTVSPKRN